MKHNMPFTLQHPAVVEDYLQSESAVERILGPLNQSSLLCLHTNRMGVVPKDTCWVRGGSLLTYSLLKMSGGVYTKTISRKTQT